MKDKVFTPASHGFVLPHLRFAPYEGENFLAPSSPFGAPHSPAFPRKTQIFVNLSTIITIFFSKTYFVNKNILEITNKFILSNQTNF